MMRRIEVVAYDPAWPRAFEAESHLMRRVLGDVLVAAHHIGSTSIPDLVAKPVIDLLLEVRDLASLDARNASLREAEYEPRGEYGIPGRRYFTRGTDTHRTHHVHAFALGHPALVEHLRFRDYLRAHPAAAQSYGTLKTELASRHPRDIEAYCRGKEPLIKDLIARAVAWDEGGRRP